MSVGGRITMFCRLPRWKRVGKTKKEEQSMSRKVFVICLALILVYPCYADIIIGNWELQSDGWFDEFMPPPGYFYSSDSRVVTLDNWALGIYNDAGWIQMAGKTFTNAEAMALRFDVGQILRIDMSMLAEEWELGSEIDTQGNETHWGVRPLENIVIQDDATGWWQQLTPDVLPDFAGDGSRDGVWKPEDGDAQFEYKFSIPGQDGFTSDLTILLITNRGPVDLEGAVYLDNARLIPEPATIAMLGLGGLALLRRKR